MTDFDFSPFDDALLATGAEDGIVSYSVINVTFACKVILYSIGLIQRLKLQLKVMANMIPVPVSCCHCYFKLFLIFFNLASSCISILY